MKHIFVIDTCVLDRAAFPSDRNQEESLQCATLLYNLVHRCHKIAISEPIYEEYRQTFSRLSERNIRAFNPFWFLNYVIGKTSKHEWIQPDARVKDIPIHEKDLMLFQTLSGIKSYQRILVTLEEEILDIRESKEIKKLRVKILNVKETIELLNSQE